MSGEPQMKIVFPGRVGVDNVEFAFR